MTIAVRLARHLRHLTEERHPYHAPAALKSAEQYLARSFRGAGCTVTSQAFRALGGTYRNIVATLPPAEGRGRASPLLVGAHYDAYEHSPGADDNASALAVLLEVAQALGARPLARPVVCVAFCLEEFNLLGSRAYVESVRNRGGALYGAIILECVGFASTAAGSQQQPPIPVKLPSVGDFLGIVGNESATHLVASVQEAAAQGPSPLTTVSMIVPGTGDMYPDTRRSDHAAFWDHGFPAIMLTDTANFRNPHYHQPTDTVETLNLSFLEQVTQTVTRAAQRLAS